MVKKFLDYDGLSQFLDKVKDWAVGKFATKDVATSEKNGLMSSSDKGKLDGLSLVSQTINGNSYNVSTNEEKGFSIYAPEEAGTEGNILASTGGGAPNWIQQADLHAGSADRADFADEATNSVNATNATNAKTAESATKATKDGDGNTISSTYVKKTGEITLSTSSSRGIDVSLSGTHDSPKIGISAEGGAIKEGEEKFVTGSTVYSYAAKDAPMKGATASENGVQGLVPAPVAGTNTKFLRGDGTWATPTDTNTTYTASTGIALNGTAFSLASGVVTPSSAGPTTAVTGNNNSTIEVPQITVDTYGRVTGLKSYTFTSKNTTYSNATTGSAGLMSASDKTKFNTISSWYDGVVGTDSDKVVNKWDEIVAFLDGIPEGDTLDGLIESVKTQVGDLKDDIEDGTVVAKEATTLGHETIGSTTNPIYLTSGVAKPCTYTLGTSVPKDAKFTDNNTTYSFSGGTNKFTVTPSGGTAQEVSVTPSISNNVTYSGTLTSGQVAVLDGTNGKIKASGHTIAKSVPSNAVFTDTHYTAKNVVSNSASSTANVSASNGNVHINLVENNTCRSGIKIVGSGATTVSCDANGNITILSSDTNTTYVAMKGATASSAGTSGLVPAPSAANATKFLRGDGTWQTPTNTTYVAATQSEAGLMSASDKKKLDGIANSANAYSLPNATSTTLGGVKVGSNITVDGGTISLTKSNVTSALGYTPPTSDTNTTYSAGSGLSLSGTTFSLKTGYTTTGKNYKVQLDSNGNPFVNVPWTDNNTTYSLATTSANGLMSSSQVSKLDGISTGANKVTATSQLTNDSGFITGITKTMVTNALGYTPPTSDTNTTYSAGSGLSLSGTTFSLKTGYTTTGKNYKVQLDSNGNPFVNVPWTDNNTTYSLATTTANGLMSSAQVSKLDGIAAGANKVTATSQLTNDSGFITGITKSMVTSALGYTPPTTNTTYGIATTTSNGLMSSAQASIVVPNAWSGADVFGNYMTPNNYTYICGKSILFFLSDYVYHAIHEGNIGDYKSGDSTKWNGYNISVVSSLPSSKDSNTIYFVV